MIYFRYEKKQYVILLIVAYAFYLLVHSNVYLHFNK